MMKGLRNTQGNKVKNTLLEKTLCNLPVPISKIDGIEFIPSDNPSDTNFKLRFGTPQTAHSIGELLAIESSDKISESNELDVYILMGYKEGCVGCG